MEEKKLPIREQRQMISSIRLGENLVSYIKQKSNELGISQNALMMVLLDLGIKLYESEVKFNRQD